METNLPQAFFSSNEKKALVVLYGQPFRNGNGFNLKIDQKILNNQFICTQTHLDFFKFIKEKYNINIETIFFTYKDAGVLIHFLKEAYNYIEDKSIFYKDRSRHPPARFMLNWVSRDVSKLLKTDFCSEYEFVFLLRFDVALDSFFYQNYFDPYEKKLKMAFPVFWGGYLQSADLFFYIPKNLFNKIPNFYAWHSCYVSLLKNKNITHKEIDYYLMSRHSCNVRMSWNPLFWIPHRKNSDILFNHIFTEQDLLDKSTLFGRQRAETDYLPPNIDYNLLYPIKDINSSREKITKEIFERNK